MTLEEWYRQMFGDDPDDQTRGEWEIMKEDGWRVVKLKEEDTDPAGPEYTTYYITEELA